MNDPVIESQKQELKRRAKVVELADQGLMNQSGHVRSTAEERLDSLNSLSMTRPDSNVTHMVVEFAHVDMARHAPTAAVRFCGAFSSKRVAESYRKKLKGERPHDHYVVVERAKWQCVHTYVHWVDPDARATRVDSIINAYFDHGDDDQRAFAKEEDAIAGGEEIDALPPATRKAADPGAPESKAAEVDSTPVAVSEAEDNNNGGDEVFVSNFIPGQVRIVLCVIPDLTRPKVEEREPLVAWLDTFESTGASETWIRQKASAFVVDFDMMVADMYQWLPVGHMGHDDDDKLAEVPIASRNPEHELIMNSGSNQRDWVENMKAQQRHQQQQQQRLQEAAAALAPKLLTPEQVEAAIADEIETAGDLIKRHATVPRAKEGEDHPWEVNLPTGYMSSSGKGPKDVSLRNRQN
ncbi:hypothetical protein ml_302 [Mollivirus sibericum]|uniref:hypothetical protein n=1 Tax=Mollivirus sibericum TaxID=1678078 RepID=UPI0006B2DCB0|nr:hypothetical protein ml_302 [Mollivirus sibericum]ALD62104.1 hypothetical protein ml_302 [Mollivirus sibericum]